MNPNQDPHRYCWQRLQEVLDENDELLALTTKLRRLLQKSYARTHQANRSRELWRQRALRR